MSTRQWEATLPTTAVKGLLCSRPSASQAPPLQHRQKHSADQPSTSMDGHLSNIAHENKPTGHNLDGMRDLEDSDLEATFRAMRLSSTEEALAALETEDASRRSGAGSRILSTSSSPSPTFSSADSSASSANANEPSPPGAGASPKKSKRVLSQLDVNELIQMKISQLETATTTEEDEEKAVAKAMKKIHKEISQVVNGQEDHLGKATFMQRKYLEMFQDMRKQERDQQKLKKKLELLQRERDLFYREKERLQKGNELLVAERNQLLEERQGDKISLTKSSNLCKKLEDLCRQFHKENRRIKEEVHQRTNQISGTFEKAIVEFKDKVEHDIAEKQRLIDENDTMLRDKFQGFLEQYDVREKHFNSVVKSKDLELQLAQAKSEQHKQIALQGAAKVELLKSQLNAFSKTEAELRKQLNVYVEKFKQVEETLNKSNSLFQTFRKEMEAMSKKGSSLEKVNLAIRAKCDTMNRNILEMAEERTKHQNALEAADKKRIKLETLCRALHAEKNAVRRSLDIYEARYPELAAAIQNGVENGQAFEDTWKSKSESSLTRTFLQCGLGRVTPAATTVATTGPTLSVQNGGVKQSKLGSRRASITSGKLRQKQKQQHLQMLLQRCEHPATGATGGTGLSNGVQRLEEGAIIENSGSRKHDSNNGGSVEECEVHITDQQDIHGNMAVQSTVQEASLAQAHQDAEKTKQESAPVAPPFADDPPPTIDTCPSEKNINAIDVAKASSTQKKSKRKGEVRRIQGRDKDTSNAPIDARSQPGDLPPSVPPSSASLGVVSRHAQAQEEYGRIAVNMASVT
ncbi:hypothetical protein BGZ75_001179 [Mortierella antarctica]|nr:hypothetical protein BGZ75_001179 [Mortierella antarctica]